MKHKLILATHKEGKLREFKEMLSGHFNEIISSKNLSAIAPEETGTTFEENAAIKAKALSHHAGNGTFVLSDDSGLCIDALGGDPGVYSARIAEVTREGKTVLDFDYAMDSILEKMSHLKNPKDRKAHFACVLSVFTDKDNYFAEEGKVFGTIAFEKKGSLGHGYDPIFIPDGYEITFAEMDQTIKNKISHRAIAIELVKQKL